jgi:S-adenosylmethionine:tRNA ribosyltransferase-isomerase
MSLSLEQFDYLLPSELIAQSPISPRDQSRLLFLNRQSGQITHHHFFNLPDLLPDDCVMVRNNTKVIPARIFGHKSTGGSIELLLLKRIKIEDDGETWECLTKPGIKLGQTVEFDYITDQQVKLQAVCVQINEFNRLIKFSLAKEKLFAALETIGHTPIPPYIKWNQDDEKKLRQIYQTTYAKVAGSAAAPTAGLHFTSELDQHLMEKGIQIEEVTLHVGLGTFLPVKTNDITQHHLHSEWFELKPEVAARLNQAKQAGKKIIAVGTTTTRVLESCANNQGQLEAKSQETNIYIYPPYKYKFIDGLITNFHLPKSTLLMLVSALISSPNTNFQFTNFLASTVGQAYTQAIQKNYRFYSFGDGMLIL